MTPRGVGSPRIAQLALAALMVAGLAACRGPGSTAADSAAASASASTGSVGNASSPSPAPAANKSVTLSWSPPTQNSDGTSLTNLAGYTLHYGTTSEDYTGSIQVTSPTETSYVVSDSSFPPGTYYFAISAYNAQQVSSSLTGEITVTID